MKSNEQYKHSNLGILIYMLQQQLKLLAKAKVHFTEKQVTAVRSFTSCISDGKTPLE